MGASTKHAPANLLASMIVAHEGEPLFAQSEVALYRARARELRLEATQTSWPDVRERVLRLAEEYELLADSLDHLS
jgi:Cys-tRNA synthase (O-phospho-L-seryl-tRNA:Cys-tRNA synthase)